MATSRQRQLLAHLRPAAAPAPAAEWTKPLDGANSNVLQQFDMTGQVVLITGGTGWLGTAFSNALAEVGATVIISSTSLERGQAAAAELPTPAGQTHLGVELNHMEEDSLLAGFAAAVEAAGKVDVLINNGLGAAAAGDITTTDFGKPSSTAMWGWLGLWWGLVGSVGARW